MKLNFNGQDKIRTTSGSIVSLLLIGVFLAYAIDKGETFVLQQNPQITQTVNPNVYNKNDSFVLNKIGFKMAFSVIDWVTFEPRNDSNFVRWRVSLRNTENFIVTN